MVFGASGSYNSDADDPFKGTLCIISFPTPSWLLDLKNSFDSDPKIKAILQKVQLGSYSSLGFTFAIGCYFTKVDCIWRTLIRI